jgi:hypothetical protein
MLSSFLATGSPGTLAWILIGVDYRLVPGAEGAGRKLNEEVPCRSRWEQGRIP